MPGLRVGDYPDYAMLCPDPAAIGVDYAIGEPEWIGRGLGTRLVWAWMLRAKRRFPDATSYFAAPDHRNKASLRVLAKVGFTEGVWFDEPRRRPHRHHRRVHARRADACSASQCDLRLVP